MKYLKFPISMYCFLGLVGNIVCMIEKNGFNITGMHMFYLDEINAAEFLEVYKGVVPEYMVGNSILTNS